MHLRSFTAVALTFSLAIPGIAQSRRLAAEDYARAEKFMPYNTNPLVLHAPGRPTWLPDDRFWYRVTTEKGTEFVLVDPIRGTKTRYSDQSKLPGTSPSNPVPNSILSPDRKRAVFIRNFNLWVTELASGEETQLTKDGVKDFGYATDNAGWAARCGSIRRCGRRTPKRLPRFNRTSAVPVKCILFTPASAIPR